MAARRSAKTAPPKFEVVWKNISDLKPSEYNPRELKPKDFERLKANIDDWGWLENLVVNSHPTRKNVIVAGHQRVEAAKKLGVQKLPCVLIRVPLEKEKRINLEMNKVQGHFDFTRLDAFYNRQYLYELGFSKSNFSFKKKDEPGKIKFSPELKESQNYVVLTFDNEIDWKAAKAKLKIETLHALKSKPGREKAGIGRVIPGAPVIARLK